MKIVDLESLSAEARLALAYAGARRETVATALALDARLGAALRGASEPIVAQLKLAWWRDRLREERAAWPAGEPLLAALADWRTDLAPVAALVDGWEALLAERLDAAALDAFAEGRAQLWRVVAAELGAAYRSDDLVLSARLWALGDLAANTGKPEERAAIAAAGPRGAIPTLPSRLRPLTVLAALGRRGLRRGGRPLLEGVGALPLAIRVGITGR